MKVKLNDVVERVTGNEDRFNTDLVFYIGGEHYDSGEILIKNKGLLDSEDGKNLGFKFHFPFKKGDVLFMARNPHLRKAGMVMFDGICSDASYILRTKNENVLMQRYLALIVQTDDFWNFFEINKTGSVNPLLNWKTLKEYEFNLPGIEIQKKLSDVLWAINDTKEAYKELLKQTDELVKSQFIEMFGKVKEKIYLEDCCTLHARVGWQALKKDEHQKSGNYMLITGTDFKDGTVDYSTCVYVSKERYDMDPYIQVKNGDILITKDGTIGKVAIVEGLPKPATLNAGIFVVRPDGRFNTGYFSYLFKGPIFADFVESSKTGSTIKHLNQAKLLKYEIPIARKNTQEKFALLYEQCDKSKFELQRAIASCDAMMKKILNENLKGTEG